MLEFLLILGFIFTQPPASLEDVIVWTFNEKIFTSEDLVDAVYVNPQFVKRAWFKYGPIPYNYFPDPAHQLWTLPPILNDSGAWFEGGVQVSELWTEAGWPCDNPYDTTHSPHQPPYKIPDPVFYDFATRDADDSLYWQPAPFFCPVTFVSIVNENLQDYVLYWAMEQIDAGVNAIEFDAIIGTAAEFSTNGVPGNNPNTRYDAYHLGTANFANRLSVVFGHGMVNPVEWFMPNPDASSTPDSAKYAFDEDKETYWVSDVSDSHWIEIDFGRKRKIQQVYLSLLPSHILSNFQVKYWCDTSGWTDFNPLIDVSNNVEVYRSFLVEPVSTNKVRLFSSDTQVYLPELQIFGCGFRQYLLKKYCVDLGWTVDDTRWETQKLVNLSDTLQCPDGTMNTFNYQKYLAYHNWTGNPFGGPINPGNIFKPYNPFFLDWFPLRYWLNLVGYFFDDSVIVDSATTLVMKSYSYQVISSFWELISDSVKNYAASQGRQIYVTHIGSCHNLPLHCDYLLSPLGRGGLFPAYSAPSATDSMRLELDGSRAQITPWRLMRRFGLSGRPNNPPIVVFLDFGFGDLPFAHLGGVDEPADQRVAYLKTYVWEIYAAGLRFCFPVKISYGSAWKDTTSQGVRLIDVIKEMTDFLNEYKEIYQDTTINSKESEVKVNGIVPCNGEWNYGQGTPVNESKVTIAYIDSDDGAKSYLHIINHNWDSLSHRMVPQDSVPVEIPVKDSCIMIRLISPDFAGEDTLPFTYHDGMVSLTIPDLAYYVVLILDLSSPGIEERENYELRIMNYELTVYPNPFMKETVIKFTVNGSQFTGKNRQLLTVNCQLKIYNLAGQLVRTLVNEQQKAGSYAVKWDGKGYNKNYLSSGIYFVKLKVGDQFLQTRKMILLR